MNSRQQNVEAIPDLIRLGKLTIEVAEKWMADFMTGEEIAKVILKSRSGLQTPPANDFRVEGPDDPEPTTIPVPLQPIVQPNNRAGGVTPTEIVLTPLDGALSQAQRGISQIPLRPREKRAFLDNWPELATTNIEQIQSWATQYPDCNWGSVAKSDSVWILEVDSPDVQKRIKAETQQKVPKTFCVRSSEGRGHFYFKQTPESIRMENISQADVVGKDWSARVSNEYVVSPLSWHPKSGKQYEVISDSEIVKAPSWLIQWCIGQKSQKNEKTKKTANKSELDNEPISEGARNSKLASIAGHCRQVLRMNLEEIEAFLLSQNERRCQPPLPDSEVKQIAASINGYTIKDDRVIWKENQTAPTPAANPAAESKLSPEEYEAELDKEYPVIPLAEQAGPSWSEDILYGPAGDVIRKAAQYNEAHPAGMLLDFLVAFGSMIGRGPYFNVNSTAHYTNEYLARVGDSSYSRKGGGRDAVDELLKLIDPDWYQSRVMSGFGSSEAIVYNVRDGSMQMQRDKKSGAFTEVMVPGVADKRLCIREGELASVFVLAGKPESRADVVLRDGWDGKILRNLVKGKTADGISNSATCKEPHLSLSADTTSSELIRRMPEGADKNGFGNRFLYNYVYRVKLCPSGGPPIDWKYEQNYFMDALMWARQQKYIPLSASAKKLWNRLYTRLDENRLPGLAGEMTSRGAAHIRRLALIYAMIDKSDSVETCHLYAARDLWEYCQESASYIFNKYTQEQLRILEFVAMKNQTTLSEIREDLFHRHKLAAWIKSQVTDLAKNGYVVLDGETVRFFRK